MAKHKLNMSVMTSLGAEVLPNGIRFALAINEYSSQHVDSLHDCGILLYAKKNVHTKPIMLPFLPEHRIGNVFCALLENAGEDEYDYNFYFGETVVTDPYAKLIRGNEVWGEQIYKNAYKKRVLRGSFAESDFDWGFDGRPYIPYEESVIYQLHVRGFTKHISSHVTHRGTFGGISEKIDYFKELGINCLEVMPLYEFEETDTIIEQLNPLTIPSNGTGKLNIESKSRKRLRLNYWGFKRGYYFAPKFSYADTDPVYELKTLVKNLHGNGIEIIMQMYFPPGFKVVTIIEILRFWVINYHIDGFRLFGTDIPVWLIIQEPVLGNSKIMYDYIDEYAVYGKKLVPPFKNLAASNDTFMNSARQFLKADFGSVGNFLTANSKCFDRINNISYISDFNTFTAYDCVSYQEKHNEENNENNRDGNDLNYSWNCGQEGATRSKKVIELRRRQFRNLMLMLLLGYHTPRIVAGDEFARTQKGNNNPYCQDNGINWIDWKLIDKNAELFQFVKALIAFRQGLMKQYKLRHKGFDPYEKMKFPDISYHGENAFIHDISDKKNGVGVMYQLGDNDYLYLIYNMHWKKAKFCLPALPAGLKWDLIVDSCEGFKKSAKFAADMNSHEIIEEKEDCVILAERSMRVYAANGERLKPKITGRKNKLEQIRKV